MNLDKEAIKQKREEIDKQIEEWRNKISNLEEERADLVTERTNYLIAQHPTVWPIFLVYAYHYQDPDDEKIIHLAKDSETAEKVMQKIISYDNPNPGVYDLPHSYEDLNKIEIEIRNLRGEWKKLIVQDKRSKEYEEIKGLEQELKKAMDDNRRYKERYANRRNIFVKLLKKKYNEDPSFYSFRCGEPIKINNKMIDRRYILTLDYDDPLQELEDIQEDSPF